MGEESRLFQVVGEGEEEEVDNPCQGVGAGAGAGAGSSRSQTEVEVVEVLGGTWPLSPVGEVVVGVEKIWSLSLARGVAMVGVEGVLGEIWSLGLAGGVGVEGAQGWSWRAVG